MVNCWAIVELAATESCVPLARLTSPAACEPAKSDSVLTVCWPDSDA